MKIEIEYENLLAGAVANNHGEEECSWPSWPVSAQ